MPNKHPWTRSERRTRWTATHNRPQQRRETASPLLSTAGCAGLAARQVLKWNNVALTSVKTTQPSENGDSARAAAAQHFQGLVWPWQSSVAGVGGDALASLPETLGPSLMNRQKHHCVLLRFLTDFETAHRRAPRIRVPVSKQISRAKRKEEEGSRRTKCLRYSFHLEPKYIWWWLFLNRP